MFWFHWLQLCTSGWLHNGMTSPQIEIGIYKVKVKWSRYRSSVAQRVGRCIALLFHDRGTRRGEWSAARPGRTLPPGKTRDPLYRRLWNRTIDIFDYDTANTPPGASKTKNTEFNRNNLILCIYIYIYIYTVYIYIYIYICIFFWTWNINAVYQNLISQKLTSINVTQYTSAQSFLFLSKATCFD